MVNLVDFSFWNSGRAQSGFSFSRLDCCCLDFEIRTNPKCFFCFCFMLFDCDVWLP